MAVGSLLSRFAGLLRWQKLLLALLLLALTEGLARGAAVGLERLLGKEELAEMISRLPPETRAGLDFIAHIELLVLGLAAFCTAGLLLWQLYWSLRQWPRATAERETAGYLLEVLPATDSIVRYTAMQSLLGQVFALLQARQPDVISGRAVTLSLEYWSTPAGTILCCWLPASADEQLLGAFAEQLRAAYPGVRLRRIADPLYSYLEPDKGERPAAVVGVTEYKLRAHSDYPLRDPESYPSDPLASLVATLQAEPGTPVVGLEIVLTAFNGAWRGNVDRRVAVLRAREAAVKKKALLPATHIAELRALGRQSDQLGFDTIVRAVVLGADGDSRQAVAMRLDQITRQLGVYDGPAGSVTQGFTADEPRVIALAAAGELPAPVRAALGRHPRPLGPLGRRLYVLGALELATLWHLPTRELAKLPGLNCWQRAQVFPAHSGVRVPMGEAASEWMITGIVARELGSLNTQPEYLGLRRAALNQHVYVNGPTRSGKTKLLENLTRQDLEQGWGVGVIDPKGDYAKKTVLMVPWEREGQVCYFDASDSTRRIMGVNPLEKAAVQRLGRDLVQSGAIGILGSLGAGWEAAPLGKRFMQHALALLLDAEPQPTFLHLYKLLQHSKEGNPYREELLERANPQTARQWRQSLARSGSAALALA